MVISNATIPIMPKRAFHWTPKLKSVSKAKSRTKRAGGVPEDWEMVEELATPIKSLTDQKIYRTIRLPNGLTALLISDPTKAGQEEKAACAISVNVGSFSDPKSIQGLAHFVEHMVFMGSEMYPVENQFDQFVTESGGTNNAVTANERTTFVFDIEAPHLPGAMDMMSQFFISPLMRKEAMQREREIIDSEFAALVLQEDMRIEHLRSCMFPDGHPFTKFPAGNLKSLRVDLKNDDLLLHREAHKFRAKHYSAHRMTVAVQAGMDMSTLEISVANTFGMIPSNGSPPDDFSRFAYSANNVPPEFRSLYYVKPISDASEVHITWCMRSLLSEYQSKPLHYINFFLQYEGKGSLLSYLKKKTWALNIKTKISDDDLESPLINTFFSTQIELTKDGLEHLSEVIEALFSYLAMMRNTEPSERIFNEMKTLADTKFYYFRSPDPSDYVGSLALKMHIYPPEHYITGDQLYFKYNPTSIKEVLDSMRANNVNIKVLSNKHTNPIQYNDKEDWFGVEYRREVIPQEWLRRWMNVAPYSEFQIPEKNVYITTNFDVIPLATPYVETAGRLGLDLERSSLHDIWIKTVNQQPVKKSFQKDNIFATFNNFKLGQPNLFFKNRYMELWYKPHLKWRTSAARLYFYFILPLSLLTPKQSCLLDLWNVVLQQELQEEIYRADMAGFSHEMKAMEKGLILKISGYSEHLHLLVDSTTSGMRTATEALTPKMFEAVRELRARTYHNDLIQVPDLAEDVLMNVLQEPYTSLRDKAVWLNKITLEDLQGFGRELFKKMYLQVLIQGNIPWYQAIGIAKKVHSDLQWESLPDKEELEIKVHQLPLGERRVRVLSLNKLSTNSIVTNYYQGEVSTYKERAVIYQIVKMMEEDLFYTLRTKEQLCYTLSNDRRSTFGVLGFSISVLTQVNKYSIQHVDQRIEAFLRNYLRELQTLDPRTCDPDDNLIQLHKADDTFYEEMERNWKEIISKEYNFERQFRVWAADEDLTMADIIDWMKNHLASSNKSMFRKLSVQIVGHNESKDDNKPAVEPGQSQTTAYKLTYLNREAKEKASEFITNIDMFKKNLPFMTVPKVQT